MVNFNYTIEDYWNRHIKDVEVDDFGESLDVNLSEEEAVELDDMMGFIIRKYNNEFNVFSFFDGYNKCFDVYVIISDIVNDYLEHRRISKIKEKAEQRKKELLEMAKRGGKMTNVFLNRRETLDNKKKFVHNKCDDIIWKLKHKWEDGIVTKSFDEISTDEIKMFRKEFFKQIKYN